MIEPPTQTIAAVPTTISSFMNFGTPLTISSPSLRVAASRPFAASSRPKSSAFTISATAPYTATVIRIPATDSTAAVIQSDMPGGRADSAIVMISADRMKSVLIAPRTLASSRCASLSFFW